MGLAGFERDFHWPQFRLAVEIDGSGHTRPRNRLEDARRDRTLDEAGYTLLRFTDDAVYHGPLEVVATVMASI
jgi:very-short-patch-repair endonuclease